MTALNCSLFYIRLNASTCHKQSLPPAVCRCNVSAGQCAWSSAVNHSAVLPQHTVHYHQYADSVRLCLAFKVHHITYGKRRSLLLQSVWRGLSACLSARPWAFQKWMTWSRFCLGGGHSCGPKEPCIRWGVQIPQWDRAVLNSSFSDPLPIEKYREVLYGMVMKVWSITKVSAVAAICPVATITVVTCLGF